MSPRAAPGIDERSPLLRDSERGPEQGKKVSLMNLNKSTANSAQKLEFSKEDDSNPRAWSRWKKSSNIAVVAAMAILSPLASSMFAPGIDKIADSLEVDKDSVIACQTGFVVMLGIGPLLLAPLSETFGRKSLYLVCFTIFTLLQIPTALAPNLPTLVALRTVAGFFGSKSV